MGKAAKEIKRRQKQKKKKGTVKQASEPASDKKPVVEGKTQETNADEDLNAGENRRLDEGEASTQQGGVQPEKFEGKEEDVADAASPQGGQLDALNKEILAATDDETKTGDDALDISGIEPSGASLAVGKRGAIKARGKGLHHGGHPEVVRVSEGALIAILFVIILLQGALYVWKKLYFRSYFRITLLGMWVVPAYISFTMGYWRFIGIWALWTSVVIWMLYRASRKRLKPGTPRMVYAFYHYTHKFFLGLAVTGYAMFMTEFFGFTLLLGFSLAVPGSLFLFYGLYFGVLARDSAELVIDSMASTMGFGGKASLPTTGHNPNVCAICSTPHRASTMRESKAAYTDEVTRLPCGHEFHTWCIRGWVLIGKKGTCLVCQEKVDFRRIVANPWTTSDRMWQQLLDALRYLVVWNPVIVLLGQWLVSYSGMVRMEDLDGG